MKRSSLIGHVVELLDTIRTQRHPADNIVREFYRARHYLGSSDRRFVTETTFGILRNFRLLDSLANAAMEAVGLGSLTSRLPSVTLYAAYSATLAKENLESILADIAGLWQKHVQGVECRQFLDTLTVVDVLAPLHQNIVGRVAIQHSFPDAIVAEWVERFGGQEAERLCKSLNQPAPVTIRVNTLKTSVPECEAALRREGVESTPTRYSPFGLILGRRVNVQGMDAFRRGYFEPQDEGSQLLPIILEPTAGSSVVDACAGGGGKTLELASLMDNRGRILSVDVSESRVRNIRQRIERAGASIVQLCLAKRDRAVIEAWRGKADGVFIDAPCSGVGTFRRNPGAKLTFTEDFVRRVSSTQRKLLETYSQLVRPGGRLVYATCSLLRKENEEVVEWFLERHGEFSLRPAPEILMRRGIDIKHTSPYLTLLPHETSTDGFFAAVMEHNHGLRVDS